MNVAMWRGEYPGQTVHFCSQWVAVGYSSEVSEIKRR